jgi:hypothetical protein
MVRVQRMGQKHQKAILVLVQTATVWMQEMVQDTCRLTAIHILVRVLSINIIKTNACSLELIISAYQSWYSVFSKKTRVVLGLRFAWQDKYHKQTLHSRTSPLVRIIRIISNTNSSASTSNHTENLLILSPWIHYIYKHLSSTTYIIGKYKRSASVK